MIAWTPALAVGIEEIDEQHRELFRAADAFLTGLETSTPGEVTRLLGYLRRYAMRHFGQEEAWMRASSYPDLAAHEAQHAQFLSDLAALEEEHGQHGGGLDPMRLAGWLGRWLTDHLGTSDARFASFMLSRAG